MSPQQNTARTRQDLCPGVLAVHQAADGGLARIRLPGGVLTVAQLQLLASAAADLGDRRLELTSRANLQIRALAPGLEGELSQRLYDAGLLPSFTHERVRNIVASPLSGLDHLSLYDVLPVAAELDRTLCATAELAELPARFLFTLDDGRGDLGALVADVAVRAIAESGSGPAGVAGHAGASSTQSGSGPTGVAEPAGASSAVLHLAGVDTGVELPWRAVPAVMTAAAEAFLAERTSQDSTAWRLAELADGPARVLDRLAAHPAFGTRPAACAPAPTRAPAPSPARAPAPAPAPAADPAPAPVDPEQTRAGGAHAARAEPGRGTPNQPDAGAHEQVDGRVAVVVAIPLGRLSSDQAAALVELASEGSGEVRVTPWRTVVVPNLVAGGNWRERLAAAGLVAEPGSAWTGMTACAARPGCAKALADVQADATDALPLLPAGRPVHWSGCERRCGRPADAIDVVATGNGYMVDGAVAGDVAAAVAARRMQ